MRILALISAFTINLIYGINYTVAKNVMPNYIKPFGFILLRSLGAVLFFWFLGIFIKAPSIEKKDYKHILIAAFFGAALNMLTFFKGLSYTTPINGSIIMITNPILVLIFAHFFLNEKLKSQKILGVFIGLFGAIFLIIYGNNSNSDADAKNIMLGNFLVFINAVSFALFLIKSRVLSQKYHPLVLTKWLYLFGLIFVLPLGFSEFIEIKWVTIPMETYLEIGFVVLLSTCVTFLLYLFALSKLKPTTVSVFIYLQPLFATIYAVIMGSDSISMIEILSAILIFSGLYLVTKQLKTVTK